MPKHKHLTEDERREIHTGLNSGESFRWIAYRLGKNPSTISKEVRLNRIQSAAKTNRCMYRNSCTVRNLCDKSDCWYYYCRNCRKCTAICPDFKEEVCGLLSKPPYVCNACGVMKRCRLSKYFYQAIPAYKSYRGRLKDSRSGISYTGDEIKHIDDVLSPLVKRKQSIHHICATLADSFICSERTVYNLIAKGVLSIRNIDLPRKVRFRPRMRGKPFKVDKSCREGRTFMDFQTYMDGNPDTSVVQMDTVEGSKGGKVMLTILFTQCDLMAVFIRERNTSQSVIDIIDTLYEHLGRETFMRLFPVILADNGSEFSNPHAIEYDSHGERRTRLFYCDPFSPYQKPEIEKSHEYIRMVLPKGRSFDRLTQDDVSLMTCHINSLIRKKLNDRSPITAFSFFHGETILHKLGLRAIPPGDVTLTPSLFLKE